MRFVVALAGALLGVSAHAADALKAQVVLVGTYHFSNPDQDLHNVKAVDVMTDPRQRELAQVANGLARFKPTRVGVEWPDARVRERYAQVRAGGPLQDRNEVVQLGFRLARAANLDSVAGLDVDGEFPFEAVADWAKKNGRQAEIDALMAFGGREVERISQWQEQHSIGGVLRELNAPDAIDRAHSFYPTLLTMGAGDEQPGARLLSAWYARNLSICARLLEQVRPGDRVVVFYGQGHIYLLRQCLREQPGIELVDPLTYLPEG